uniref:Uncharacterized protein n=1 Tax=Chelydra serpentina TaxID=8475 RepID=A0A8C3T2J5_CHESE
MYICGFFLCWFTPPFVPSFKPNGSVPKGVHLLQTPERSASLSLPSSWYYKCVPLHPTLPEGGHPSIQPLNNKEMPYQSLCNMPSSLYHIHPTSPLICLHLWEIMLPACYLQCHLKVRTGICMALL